MDAPVSDEQLMLRYQAGNAAAFDALYERHRGGLYRFILRQCSDAAIADELYQDVWLKVIKARNRYTASAKFSTYLYRMARHRLIDFYRRNATRAQFLVVDNDAGESAGSDVPGPERRVSSRQALKEIEALLHALPEEQRSAFLMREEGGMSIHEIAVAMSVTMETAKSRLRYAVAKLRDGLGDDYG